MDKPVHKFTIKRSEWLRGEQDSYLLRVKDGKKCCLGFYCESIGISAKELLGKESPTGIAPEIRRQRHNGCEWLLGSRSRENCEYYSEAANALMLVNDGRVHYGPNERNREEEIRRLFAKQNIEVAFED